MNSPRGQIFEPEMLKIPVEFYDSKRKPPRTPRDGQKRVVVRV